MSQGVLNLIDNESISASTSLSLSIGPSDSKVCVFCSSSAISFSSGVRSILRFSSCTLIWDRWFSSLLSSSIRWKVSSMVFVLMYSFVTKSFSSASVILLFRALSRIFFGPWWRKGIFVETSSWYLCLRPWRLSDCLVQTCWGFRSLSLRGLRLFSAYLKNMWANLFNALALL